MDPGSLVGSIGIYAATFAIATISSVLPIISIELFLIGVAMTAEPAHPSVLVALAATGQVLGKLPIYYASRGAARLCTRGTAERSERRRERLRRIRERASRWHPGVLLATSSILGLPPFSLLATAAGVLAIPARTFSIVVALGRAARFAAILAVVSGV